MYGSPHLGIVENRTRHDPTVRGGGLVEQVSRPMGPTDHSGLGAVRQFERMALS